MYTSSARLLAALSTMFLVALHARSAAANGAFPDSFGVLAPADRPQEVIVTTNFGLILSQDGGASWSWACETSQSAQGYLYQMSAPPLDRLMALTPTGMIYSDNRGCQWQWSKGSARENVATDFFPDPVHGDHVLSIAAPRGSGGMPLSVYESFDGGANFGAPIYGGSEDLVLAGVESSRSDPNTIYLSGHRLPDAPVLIQSVDGGMTWSTHELTAALGRVRSVRIIGVDPDDSKKVFLRVLTNDGEILAITEDGGVSVRTPLRMEGTLAAFARLRSGVILVAGMLPTVPFAYRSEDGGATFTALVNPPHFKGFAERGGQLLAATDDVKDAFALGASLDEGATWRPLLHYKDVRNVRPCLAKACQATCFDEVQLGIWQAPVCEYPAAPDLPPAPSKGLVGCSIPPAPDQLPTPLGILTLITLLLQTKTRPTPVPQVDRQGPKIGRAS